MALPTTRILSISLLTIPILYLFLPFSSAPFFLSLSLSPYTLPLLLFFFLLFLSIVSISLGLSTRTAHCYFLFYATHPERAQVITTPTSRPPWPFPCPTLSPGTASEDRIWSYTREGPAYPLVYYFREYEWGIRWRYKIFPRFNQFHAPTRGGITV